MPCLHNNYGFVHVFVKINGWNIIYYVIPDETVIDTPNELTYIESDDLVGLCFNHSSNDIAPKTDNTPYYLHYKISDVSATGEIIVLLKSIYYIVLSRNNRNKIKGTVMK